MENRLLTLNFVQLSKAWAKSKFNNYSDIKKKKHIEQLAELYNKIKKEDFSTLGVDDVARKSYIIDFFFKNLEFLENSTLNLIPFEIVECLKYALSDWLDSHEEYIIVTSLINDSQSYSFDPTLAINYYFQLIRDGYGVDFLHRLVQINIPRFLVRDYLASVVLYHELGHFVDSFYEITPRIAKDIALKISHGVITGVNLENIEHFFPFLNNPNYLNPRNLGVLESHIAEYFCDIFASQYVGSCLNDYLLYITKNEDQPSSSHPASTTRVEMVNLFLQADKTSYTLNLLIEAIQAMTSRVLMPRYVRFENKDLEILLPVEIREPNQLHYLFVEGWRIWMKNPGSISTNNNISPQLEDDKVYEIINNLIEKSIGNFIVTSSWDKNL